MNVAYVDTSCLVAVALSEPGHEGLVRRLREFDQLFSSNLAEAELRSALSREKLEGGERLLEGIDWVFPGQALSARFEEVLEHGHQRGADLFHLACALHLREAVGELAFVTVDRRQQAAARALGM